MDTKHMTAPQQYRVITPYQSPYPESIHYKEGERVVIGREYNEDPDWKDWLWCTGESRQSAWVPRQYLAIDGPTGILKRAYNARELSVSAGEMITILYEINSFGMAEKADGSKGWVPMRILVRE